MSTDHTNGSSWDAATDPSTHQAFVLPIVDDAVKRGPETEGEDEGQELSPQQELASLECQSEQEHGESDQATDLSESPDLGESADPTRSADTALRESLREDVADAMEFRVLRPGTPVRRLRLTGNRYTLGSAEGCSIRLNDHDIRPMHAVLMRDGARILVRAYSIPIQVNDDQITEAELHPGDRLQLGAYRFELLSSEDADRGYCRSTSPSGRLWESASGSQSTRPLGDPRSPSDRLRGGAGWQSADDLFWKERLRREIDQWRERQLECDRRESRCDQREANLRTRETELWSRAENLYRRESRLQSQEAATLQLYDEFAKRQQELLEAREATRRKEESLHQREVAFRNQEIEYRQRLEEATQHLQSSQEQAETATEAVARMRQQFDSLTEQIEALSSQHTEIELREVQQRAEHQHLIDELQKSRDAAIEAQAQSQARRQEAEQRVERLETQLAMLREDRGSDLVAQQEKLAEAQQVADALRKQVEELQQQLATATDESAKLRTDYEDAVASVLKLESIIAETSKNGESDREAWESEADELRASVERLSTELNKANRDLRELRDANSQLTARLDDMQRQRDEARADADARPTLESVHTLEEELNVAREQLAEAELEREDALQELSAVRHQWERDQEAAAQQIAEALAAAETSRDATSPSGEPASTERNQHAPGPVTGETVARHHDALGDTADPFDPEPDFPSSKQDQGRVDIADEFVIEEESNQSDWEEESDWILESPELTDGREDSRESDSMWNQEEPKNFSRAGFDSDTANKDPHPDSIWGQDDVEEEHLTRMEDRNRNDDSSETTTAGSLASMLIRDLDEEAHNRPHRDSEMHQADWDARSHEAPTDGWDHEHTEEAYATRWSNHPDGYRIEAIDVSDRDEANELDGEKEHADHLMPRSEASIPSEDSEFLNDDPQQASDDAAVISSSDTASEDEDSIEAYMNRLLRRVQGRPIEEAPVPKPDSTKKAVAAEKPKDETPKKRERLKPDEPLVPRSQAPEKTTSLSAMRELANTSARIAISRSVRVQTRDTQLKGIFNFACAVGAIACGIACYFFIPGLMRYLAVAMTIIVASIYVHEGWQLLREASRNLKAAQDGQPKSESEEEIKDNKKDEAPASVDTSEA